MQHFDAVGRWPEEHLDQKKSGSNNFKKFEDPNYPRIVLEKQSVKQKKTETSNNKY